MTILDEIAAKAKERVAAAKQKKPLEQIMKEAQALDSNTGFPFEKALRQDGVSLICEVKKASPSKGLIAPDFPYVDIAKAYEEGGASAISILTEPFYFQGSELYLQEIRQAVKLPLLRKDFTVDEYMIYEAKVLGADAILLICAILSDEQLRSYREIAESLGISALVEAHDDDEIKRAIQAGAKIIGVNNRDLRDFTVDVHNSLRYRKQVPEDIVFVSESGIKTGDDVDVLYGNKVDAALIGETLMRAKDKIAMLKELRMGGHQRMEEE